MPIIIADMRIFANNNRHYELKETNNISQTPRDSCCHG